MFERRRAPRIAFGGVAEATSVNPDTYIIASTTGLSRFGCFVTTRVTMPIGTTVGLKITHEGRVFNASGEVVYVLPERGIGIKFIPAEPSDVAVLEAWQRQTLR
jgi:hypothetical protein